MNCFKRHVIFSKHQIKLRFYCNANGADRFQNRMLEHFRSDAKYEGYVVPKTSVEFKYKDIIDINDPSVFRSVTTNDMLEHIQSIHYYKRQKPSLIRSVDKMCCLRLPELCDREIMKYLDAWMYVIPNKVMQLKFYQCAVNIMENWLYADTISDQLLVLSLFYIGLQKGNYSFQNKFSKIEANISKIFENLTLLEMCIVLNAIFKIGQKIASKKILQTVNTIMEKKLPELVTDSALLVTFVKCLKHAKCHEYQLLSYMSHYFVSNSSLKIFSFTTKVHILTLYADSLYNFSKDKNFSWLINECLNDMKNTVKYQCEDDSIRQKDIYGFLWALSFIGYDVHTTNFENLVTQLVRNFISKNAYDKKPEQLSGTLLYMWMLRCKSVDLIKEVVGTHLLLKLKEKNRVRFNSRFCLLLSAIQIEKPDLLPSDVWIQKDNLSIVTPNNKIHMDDRQELLKVYYVVQCLSSKLGYTHVVCNFIIPHLYIAGITVKSKSGATLSIEILDSTVCLHNSQIPHGLMKLKLRLLQVMKYPYLVITQNDVLEYDESEHLFPFIEDKMMEMDKQS